MVGSGLSCRMPINWSFSWAVKFSLFIVLASAVAGCSLFGSGKSDKKVPLTRTGSGCPNIQILGDLREKTVFRPGAGRGKFDILYAGQIKEYFVGCSVRRVKGAVGKLGEVPRILAVRLSPVIWARRNLGKGSTETATLDYFIGVVRSDETPLEKKIIPLLVKFRGDHIDDRIQEKPITLVLKMQPSERVTDFSIFLGFQLNREQLQFNRERLNNIRKQQGL